MALRPGLHDLYSCDPGQADEQIWGRRSNPLTRRGFLPDSGLAAIQACFRNCAALSGLHHHGANAISSRAGRRCSLSWDASYR